MSLYDAAKDAIKIAQKADNVELIQKLLDVQQMALDMQGKQQVLQAKITELENENKELIEINKFEFASGKNFLIDPEFPSRRLCPLCTKKHKTAVPLDGSYCRQCKGVYE